MKYSAFKIDDDCIKMVDGKYGKYFKVVKGYFVRGKKITDYNWELLSEFDSEDDAKEYIKSIRTEGVYQPVYGLDGYGIKF